MCGEEEKLLRRVNISREKNASSCEPRDLDSSGNRSARNVFRSRNTVNDDL